MGEGFGDPIDIGLCVSELCIMNIGFFPQSLLVIEVFGTLGHFCVQNEMNWKKRKKLSFPILLTTPK